MAKSSKVESGKPWLKRVKLKPVREYGIYFRYDAKKKEDSLMSKRSKVLGLREAKWQGKYEARIDNNLEELRGVLEKFREIRKSFFVKRNDIDAEIERLNKTIDDLDKYIQAIESAL